MSMDKPTTEGLRRYPWSGGYYDTDPCTCTEECDDPCQGDCDCLACLCAYSDACDADYLPDDDE